MLVRWIDRAAKTYERSELDVRRVLGFVAFVGVSRALLEWVLGGLPPRNMLDAFVQNASFYWVTFWTYGLVVKWCVPGLPWRRSVNVVLFGLFLGVFPPIIDALAYGLGNGLSYTYIKDISADWVLLFYNPTRRLNIGETAIIWSTIIFSSSYVGLRSKSLGRALAAFVLAYLGVLLDGALASNLARAAQASLQWEGAIVPVLLTLFQLALAIVLYLAYRPALVRHFLRRLPHLLPFVLITFVGASLAGALGVLALVYAGGVLLLAYTAAIQNDHFDAGGEIEPNDVVFFNATSVLMLMLMFSVNATPAIAYVGISWRRFCTTTPSFVGNIVSRRTLSWRERGEGELSCRGPRGA